MAQRRIGFGAGMAVGVLLAVSAGAVGQGRPMTEETRNLMRRFGEVFQVVRTHFVIEPNEAKMIDGCLSGMLRGLDGGQSDYLSPADFNALRSPAGGPRAGTGFEMSEAPHGMRVIAPLEGSPAERAGLLPGDVVIRVDDTDLGGMSMGEAVKLLRGDPGSRVRLTLLRPGLAAPLELALVREVIRVQEVRSRLVEPALGYVRISQFRDTTHESLGQALLQLQSQSPAPLRGIVIDLRNNPGGLLNSGIAAASIFLRDDQLVMSTEGRSETARRRYHARPADFMYSRDGLDFRARIPHSLRGVPLVVLVNRGSAAASEILAVALQEHGRAAVIGERTFGRGSIQTILQLSDSSAVKLTTSHWHSPQGRPLQAQGVAPDVVLDGTALMPQPTSPLGGSDDPGLQRAIRHLERRS